MEKILLASCLTGSAANLVSIIWEKRLEITGSINPERDEFRVNTTMTGCKTEVNEFGQNRGEWIRENSRLLNKIKCVDVIGGLCLRTENQYDYNGQISGKHEFVNKCVCGCGSVYVWVCVYVVNYKVTPGVTKQNRCEIGHPHKHFVCFLKVCSQKLIGQFLSNWDICDLSCCNIKKIIRKFLILLIITSKIIIDM